MKINQFVTYCFKSDLNMYYLNSSNKKQICNQKQILVLFRKKDGATHLLFYKNELNMLDFIVQYKKQEQIKRWMKLDHIVRKCRIAPRNKYRVRRVDSEL